jgi:hypothetical protein
MIQQQLSFQPRAAEVGITLKSSPLPYLYRFTPNTSPQQPGDVTILRWTNNTNMVDPGLHVIFDSQVGAAEIEYVFLASGFCNSLTNHLYSVVAVHGLNFMNSPAHARETWAKGGRLWLKDFLPAKLPKSCRVMLFEYNSSPAMGASAIKLDDHAKNLLQWLSLKRKERCHPPK